MDETGNRRRSSLPCGRQSIGLRQVAEIAGVSTATVSRAINNPETVSAKLRERVASVVRQLEWVPDAAARALVTRRSHTVGIVLPGLQRGDFSGAVDGLQDELSRLDYTLLLARSNYDYDQELQQVRKFVERGVDAVLLIGEQHHHDLNAFLAKNHVLHLNMFAFDPQTRGNSIGPDNRKALYKLTRYLIELGHRRFGIIVEYTATNDRAQARVKGIQDALAEHGLAVRPDHFAVGERTIRQGRKMFRNIVAAAPRPTAVICCAPSLAVGGVLESQALGIRVPHDMSIVAYDDTEIMRELPIPITTIRTKSEEVGKRAGQRIVALLEGRHDTSRESADQIELECPVELLVRASSGASPEVERSEDNDVNPAKKNDQPKNRD